MLPKTHSTYFSERIGINAVATAIAKIGLIWRETPTGDVGVDGQVEYVDESGRATGRLVSVQVKSGMSYFTHEHEHEFLFYPEERHRNYWEQHPLPVILVLHNTDTQQSHWADVRQQLRGEKRSQALSVGKARVLQRATAGQLFETTGVNGGAFIEDLSEVLAIMVRTRSASAGFPVSHFDLFVHGLTNIARSIYYGMDVAMMVVEHNLDAANAESGWAIGEPEHEFMFAFVKFLIAQNLARVEFADCLTDWIDRERQPHFVAPLTSRGRSLVALIHRIEGELVDGAVLPDAGLVHVAQEAFFSMVQESFSTRLPRIQTFQQALNDAARQPPAPDQI